MSITSIGAVKSCLQNNCRLGLPSTLISTRPRFFYTTHSLSCPSTHPRKRLNLSSAPRYGIRRCRLRSRGLLPTQSAPAGQTKPVRDSVESWSGTSLTLWNNSVRRARKHPLRPSKHKSGKELIPLWRYLYRKLAFPENDDHLKARREMQKNQREAELLVRSPKKRRTLLSYKRKRWVPLFIGGLAHSAKLGLSIMSIMAKVPGIPWRIQSDCLHYLNSVHRSEIQERPVSQILFSRRLKQLSCTKSWPKSRMPRNGFVTLLNHNTPSVCNSIIHSVLKMYDPVPVSLRLVMVDHYTKQNQPEHAIKLLSQMPTEQLKHIGPELYGRYHNLIQIDNVERTSSGTNFKILPRLVDLGLPLTDGMHNEVLVRAVALGLPEVAWEVYRYLESNNIIIEARSHLVLLRNSFLREDLEGLNTIMSSIYQRKDLYKNAYLVSYTMNIVRVVCTIQRSLPAEASLSHILAVYDRAYSRAPLVKLGITDPLPENRTNASLPLPDGVQLGFALWTYVLVQRSDYSVARFWEWFLHLVNQGDPQMVAAARHDVLYNGLILYWSRRNNTLLNMVEILEQMVQLGLCVPTELTWSLLICGFLKHNQEQAAEKVRQTMISRNVHPNTKGWNFMLQAYGATDFAARVRETLDEKKMPEGLNSPSDLPVDDSLPSQDSPLQDWKSVGLVRARLWSDDMSTSTPSAGPQVQV